MALPYAPEGYYRAPQNNISELIMRQGDIAARRAEQNARIWGGAIQDIGNVAGQAIGQYAEQKSLSKQAAALDAILSDPNGPDPQKIIKTLGYHNGIEVVKGLQAIHPQVSYEDASMREYDAAKAILASPEELRPGLYEKARAQLTTLGHLDPKVAPETYDEGFLRRVVAQRAPAKDAPKLERIVDNLGGGKVNIRYVDPSKVGPEGITVNEAAVAPKRSLFDILNDPKATPEDKQRAIDAERQASAAGRDPNAWSWREQSRLDHSYEFKSRQLEKDWKPLMDQAARFDRLRDAIDAGSAQADALIAPELLITMAGGQGTGLRINEAEIERVVSGRSTVEEFKAKVKKFVDGGSVTDETRQQIRTLMKQAQGKVMARAALVNDADGRLVDAKSVDEQRRIVVDLRSKLLAASDGSGDQGGEQIIATPDGKKWKRQPDGSMVEVH